MRKVHLHGELGAKFGNLFELDVETVGETVRALDANFPRFIAELRDGSYHIVRGEDVDSGVSLDEKECAGYRLGRADLHIVPVIAGSKRQGTLKIIIGAALVGLALVASGGALAAPLAATGALSALSYGNIALFGLTLALSGVSQLLAPETKTLTDSDDKSESFLMAGPGNVYEQGSPVPLVYGRVITGGVLVSAGIDIESLA